MKVKSDKPRQARSLRKRELLLQAGEAEFSSAGYAGATSRSIAERAGVATGSFYQHFENKDALLRELAEQRFAILHENLPDMKAGISFAEDRAVKDLLHRSLVFIYQFHAQSPELHQVLEERRHQDEQLRQVLQTGEDALQKRVLQFVKNFKVTKPEVVASNLFAMAEGLVHRQVFSDSEIDPEQTLEYGARMLASYFELHR